MMADAFHDALIAAPLMLPAMMAAIILLIRRHRALASALSLSGTLGLCVISFALLCRAGDGTISAYAMGDWAAPFGIILVLDRLSAMMVMLTSVLALLVLLHAMQSGLTNKGRNFHPLFQFQLLGLNGAFLTGDLFNLFVFFEVLLIASYGLMLHGQGKERLQAGIQYVVVNLAGSTLFLVAAGMLYGITGTLNMADMALRAAELPAGDQGLLRAAGLLLTIVFALKAALLPLHLWLPRSYAGAAPAVAALFAIMTKIGAYAIIRTVTLIFGDDAGTAAWAPGGFMLPAALGSVLLGFIGLLVAQNLRFQAAYALVGSTGILLVAIALFTPPAMMASLYYLIHTTLGAALLFLLADLVARARGPLGDRLIAGAKFRGVGIVGAFYMLGAIALIGMPPLSGFIGKLMILDAALASPHAAIVWAIILGASVLALLGFTRAGSSIFWKASKDSAAAPAPLSNDEAAHQGPWRLAPAGACLALIAALTIFAGPVTHYTEATAQQLFNPQHYISAVMAPPEGGQK